MYLFQNDYNYFFLSKPADSTGIANVSFKARDSYNSCQMMVSKSVDYPNMGYEQ